jgi:hypothetical protein
VKTIPLYKLKRKIIDTYNYSMRYKVMEQISTYVSLRWNFIFSFTQNMIYIYDRFVKKEKDLRHKFEILVLPKVFSYRLELRADIYFITSHYMLC